MRGFLTVAWVVLLPVLAALARLVGHPEYYFDGETQIPPTIGRELLHGHLADAFHYQIIVYQGSLLWDALLSAGAYAVFGDHLLAWHAVPLGYLAGLSVAGTLLLRRLVGPGWSLLFPALLGTLPFFVKDGFVSGIGGHAPGAFYAVAGLAAAAYSGGEGGKRRYAVLAGLILGFGTWYVRTVLLAIPAALLLVGHRVVGRLLLVLGLLSLPVLLALNVVALQSAGSHAAAQGTIEDLTREVVWNVQGTAPHSVPAATKVLQATGPGIRTLLFAQPHRHRTVTQSHRPLAYTAGLTWSVAWPAGLVLLPALLLVPGIRRRPGTVPGVLAVFALGAAYVGAYAFSSLNLDPGITESLRQYPPLPPGVSGGRYLVPIFGVLTLSLALAVGLLGTLAPRIAAAAIAPVLALGLIPAAGDWAYDRDPIEIWRTKQPHIYSGAFGPGRGPPLEAHLACDDPDEQSREAHLEAIGRFLVAESGEDPASLVASVERLRETGRTDEEIGRLVGSLGSTMIREMRGGSLSFMEATKLVFETAEALGPGPGDAYLLGTRSSFRDGGLDAPAADVVDRLCATAPSGTRPLCSFAGEALADPNAALWPDRPEGLFRPGMPSFDGLERSTRDALLFGAAAAITRGTPGELPAAWPEGWDPEDGRTFVRKWRVKGGRVGP